MQKFRWAYIGSGNIAHSTANSILNGKHRIVSVYGRNADKVKKFATMHGARAYTDFDEAISADDVDGVYIATPHTSHVDYAIRALQKHKPVLCEKPVGVNVCDVDTILDTALANNTYFAEAMWTWFSDVALQVKAWVNGGKIGEVKRVTIHYAFPGILMPKSSRLLMPETAGGALLDIGIYPITYCYNIFGYPDTITCHGRVKNGIDISETVTLTYGNTDCKLHMSLSSLREGCTIVGTEGKITIPVFHMASRAVLKNADGRQVFNGKTDYLTEFTRAAEEIAAGKTQSDYIPFSATRDCMQIMDECRRQMKLKYPFEV